MGLKYYIKRMSGQDIGRTTVLNVSAIKDFFMLDLKSRGEEAEIQLRYLPGSGEVVPVRIVKKQDPRIFLDKSYCKESDLLLFENEGEGVFSLQVITPESEDYSVLLSKLNNNFLLTDKLPTFKAGEEEISYSVSDLKIPLNQILFGPPGTGKTWSTIKKSLEILGRFTGNTLQDSETFRSLLNKRICFATMHPSYSYEDFVQGMKPVLHGDSLGFKYQDGVFKKTSEKARFLLNEDGEVFETGVSNKNLLRVCFFLSRFNTPTERKANRFFGDDKNSEVFRIVGQKFNCNPNSVKNHRDKFDYVASDYRKGWTPNNGTENLDNTPLWPYHDIWLDLKDKSYEQMEEVVRQIEEKAQTRKTGDNNMNFVMILDEINRANISKVFGELITLIEEDKRLGAENELTVTLPSGEIFGVPSNLYIIGTMNTADKSIALVDIALRRRFQFIPVYPDPEVIENFGKSADKDQKKEFMKDINKVLRNEKGVDFQIGHAYFLKDNTLTDVINENIIPLLTEYFRNDLGKVKKILAALGYGVNEEYFDNTGLLLYKV